MTWAAFFDELKALQPRIATMNCRVVPSSFDADSSEIIAYPLPTGWRWKSCEEILLAWKPTGVVVRLPLFWQAEVPLFRACRKAGAAVFMNEPENMPVGGASITGANIDTVITEASDAYEFAQYLSQKHIELPRNWFVVHRFNSHEFSIPELLRSGPLRVAQEIHLMPMVPLAHQCPILAGQRVAAFHAYADEQRFVELPMTELTLREGGVCECGAPILRT